MMNPTSSQIAFRLRKIKTNFDRLDVDKDGYMSRMDFEIIAKRMNELSNATEEQAEACHNAFMHVADTFGYTPGVRIAKEEAIKFGSEVMLKKPWEEQRAMCDNFHNAVFDAVDVNRDGHISLEEYKTYLQALAPDISDEDKVKSFNLIDVNHDGEISREEFLNASFEYFHGFEENELSKVFFGPLVP
jgi:Ca2+-binding EF-hand superfamily protein